MSLSAFASKNNKKKIKQMVYHREKQANNEWMHQKKKKKANKSQAFSITGITSKYTFFFFFIHKLL